MSIQTTLEPVRLDKWLWAARFYKTRSLASQAISGGHVRYQGARCKPSQKVTLDSHITVRKGIWQMQIQVKHLSRQRGPAMVAQTLYQETEASQMARQQQASERKLQPTVATRRPDKKQRRQIHRFRQENSVEPD